MRALDFLHNVRSNVRSVFGHTLGWAGEVNSMACLHTSSSAAATDKGHHRFEVFLLGLPSEALARIAAKQVIDPVQNKSRSSLKRLEQDEQA